ncbi:MAG: ATP-binding cassette domain-containing protein [Clostridiales bacterium]|nr:ATP-binding cassette domain-containing protein [Clostridiales bacterium]
MILKIEELSKTFGTKKAVDRISFEMNRPGVFGIIGTNGAGKTTTIRMMLGIIEKDSGSATWNGKTISRETMSFGYMPEERGIYTKVKVLEQLIYFGQLRGMSRGDAKKSALAWMERLGVSEYKDMVAEKVSKGNQQKIQLLATLIHNPDLIVLDEPFSGLDPVNTELIRKLIAELVEEGKYIVMSSHQMATVEEFCENLVMLHNGETIVSGNLKQIKAGYGHTNLLVRTEEDVTSAALETGLKLLAKRADETEFKIEGDDMAEAFLSKIISAGHYPVKYEIREPSLHEIFLEKAVGSK